LLVALSVVVVYHTRRTILIFTVALLLAYLLSPMVGLLDRLRPRRFPRVLSLAAVYVLLIAVVSFAIATVGTTIYTEASLLADKVPQWLSHGDPLTRIPVPAVLVPWKARVIEAIHAELTDSAGRIAPLVGEVGQGLLSALGNFGFVILVPILSFFFLKDAAAIRGKILDQLAEGPSRTLLEDVLSDVHVLLGQFMRALVILSLATLVSYYVFLLVAGLPYAALLAAVAAMLEFIPVLGPLSAGVIIVLVALLSGGLKTALWVLMFLLGYRLFQDYVLQPWLMGVGVELHPLWIIFGVLAGEQIGGVAGMFLSIPVLASLRVVYVRIQKARHSPAALTGPQCSPR
jgi:predicted PurR-regulated permease PerM